MIMTLREACEKIEEQTDRIEDLEEQVLNLFGRINSILDLMKILSGK